LRKFRLSLKFKGKLLLKLGLRILWAVTDFNGRSAELEEALHLVKFGIVFGGFIVSGTTVIDWRRARI